MTTIGQYVRLDTEAGFRNDVQLDAYDKSHNLSLLKSYLFTSTAPDGWSSSLGILGTLIDTFNNGRLENRIVTIANYGHGKSHLALALANYFGRQYGSEELKVLLGKIETTVHDRAEASKYVSFKQNGGKHLIVRLRGDVAGSMRSQFIHELEQALDADPKTQGTRMPFWFNEAESLLTKLSGENLDKANDYLHQYNLDVPELIENVRARKMEVYDQCVEAIRAAYGFAPDLGSEVSLKQILNWAVRKFCDTDKPFRGILILFDEFSLYLYNYVARNSANELQDLMNGVADNHQKVIFLAFSQQDPIEYVKTFVPKGMLLDTILKELNRIPRKMLLYSLMESVIDSYLYQDDKLWDALFITPGNKGWFTSACDITFDAFPSRYKTTLRWRYEDFRETVAKGCFPLHPMTTALLCNVKFQAVSGKQDPRTVLGFVLDQLGQRQDQLLTVDDRINWIFPVELVDFFNDQLSGERYRLYDNARRMLGPDALDKQKNALKALLLHDIAEMRGGYQEQVDLIAAMAGIESGMAKGILKQMAEQRIIRQDPITRKFSFWSGSLDISDYDQVIQDKITNTSLDKSDIQKLGSIQLSSIPVPVEWGKPDDWAAKSVMMLAKDFTVENVGKEILGYKANTNGINAADRGIVFWILAKTSAELNAFTTTAHTILDQATVDKPSVPVLVILPRDASPNLMAALIRHKALLSFKRDEQEKYKEMYTQDAALVNANISKEIRNLSYDNQSLTIFRPRSAYLTTSSFSSSLIGIGQANISSVLTRVYESAYKFSPPEFYTQYAEGGINLKNAVKLLAGVLMANGMNGHSEVIETNAMVKQMIDNFLISKWGLLNPVTKHIQPPTNARMQAAWKVMDDTFCPNNGEVSVQSTLITLLNSPYGYDYNTLTLLFSAWFGYNVKDLKVSIGQRKKTHADVIRMVDAGPKDFLGKICVTEKLYLARQDLSEFEKKVLDAISLVDRGNLSVQQAEEMLPDLEKYLADDRFDEVRRSQAQSAQQFLLAAIEQAKRHYDEAEKIKRNAAKTRDLNELLSLQGDISSLPSCIIVLPNGPKRTELLASVNERLKTVVEERCQQAQGLDNLYNYGYHQKQLESLQTQLKKEHLTSLAERVGQALQALDVQKTRLERVTEEKSLRQTIDVIDYHFAGLQKLYEYRDQLKAMQDLPDAVAALRNNKLTFVQLKIEEIESGAQTLLVEFNRVTTLKQLNSWYNRFHLYRQRVEETSIEKEFEATAKACEQLRNAFDDLVNIDNAPINKPADVTELQNKLEGLEKKYRSTSFAGMQLIFKKSQTLLDQRYARLVEDAGRALAVIESDFLSRKQPPHLLMQRLEVRPVFLAEDCADNWDALKARVKAKMDEDTVEDIVQRFVAIGDLQKQAECAKRLLQILKQKGE